MAAYDGWAWPRKAGTNLRWNLWWGEGGEDVFFFLLSILSLGSPKLPRAPPRAPCSDEGSWFLEWGLGGCGKRQTGLAYPGAHTP